jgi:arginine repressor
MPDERKSHAKELVRRATGREVDELLRELYVEKRHSQQEIADGLAALGVSLNRMTISNWLAEYGITRDDRPPAVITA